MTVIAIGNPMIDEGKILWTHLAVLRLVRTSTGVLRLIRAYRNYSYGRTTTVATWVLRYLFNAYTVHSKIGILPLPFPLNTKPSPPSPLLHTLLCVCCNT